jgi:hypothetical protein
VRLTGPPWSACDSQNFPNSRPGSTRSARRVRGLLNSPKAGRVIDFGPKSEKRNDRAGTNICKYNSYVLRHDHGRIFLLVCNKPLKALLRDCASWHATAIAASSLDLQPRDHETIRRPTSSKDTA